MQDRHSYELTALGNIFSEEPATCAAVADADIWKP